MRRIIATFMVVALAVALSFNVVGCSGKQGSPGTGSSTTTATAPSGGTNSEEASENDSIESTREEGVESSSTP